VDCTIKPAKANNATAKITKAISTSISEKPLDFLERFNGHPPENGLGLLNCKSYTNEVFHLTFG